MADNSELTDDQKIQEILEELSQLSLQDANQRLQEWSAEYNQKIEDHNKYVKQLVDGRNDGTLSTDEESQLIGVIRGSKAELSFGQKALENAQQYLQARNATEQQVLSSSDDTQVLPTIDPSNEEHSQTPSEELAQAQAGQDNALDVEPKKPGMLRRFLKTKPGKAAAIGIALATVGTLFIVRPRGDDNTGPNFNDNPITQQDVDECLDISATQGIDIAQTAFEPLGPNPSPENIQNSLDAVINDLAGDCERDAIIDVKRNQASRLLNGLVEQGATAQGTVAQENSPSSDPELSQTTTTIAAGTSTEVEQAENISVVCFNGDNGKNTIVHPHALESEKLPDSAKLGKPCNIPVGAVSQEIGPKGDVVEIKGMSR